MTANPAIDIPNLLYTYAIRFDDGDFEGAARLFKHGCVVAEGHRIAGVEAITAMWRQWVRLHDGKPRTRHLTTNPIIALADDGQSATCVTQWTVLQAAEGYPLQIVASGRYHDTFALIAGAWAFTERVYQQTDLVGDTSAHLIRELSES
ncbi:MAG: nuclear transport factor 2 family protein [Novosphingobium sp.]|nr:nuclear transport factor 2 family protein [Novosphingobium sp.]